MSLVELFSVKKNKKEQSSIDDLNEKVEIDSYFRVRRDILLRYFGRVVMVMIFMFSVVYLFSAFYFSNINLFYYDPAKTILIGIISLYAIRIFYESSLVGLYMIPTKLGLVLSVPQNESFYKKEVDTKINWNKISFKTNKVKLVEEGEYYKKLSISIEKNNNYLFLGDSMSGKTSLANIFDSYPDLNENAWIIKKDNQRFSIRRWSEIFDDKYLIGNNLPTEKKIGEIIFKKDSSEINERDIKKLNSILEKYDFLKPYFVKKRFVGDSVRVYKNNESIIFFIQALYCLVNNVSLIIIDNKWSDLNYEEIDKTIKMLDEEIDNKTIVIFSRRKNNILYYNNIYEIQKNKIILKEQ
jgi:ABC-type lipoprotein export system ATPase subunit